MKKQYALVLLIIIFLYLLFLVGSYTYNDYRISLYIEDMRETNNTLLGTIWETERELEQKMTLAHKNKVLKTEQWLKNRGEEVLFLISEERYRMFTQEQGIEIESQERTISERIWDTENLISTMTNYERWIFFLFGRDIR